MCTEWVLNLQTEELPTGSAQFTIVMNGNSRQISCLFLHTYCAIKISPPPGSIWAWREYNFPQWIIPQLSKQQDRAAVQSKKLMAMGLGIMRGSTWRKQFVLKKIKTTYLPAIFESPGQQAQRKAEITFAMQNRCTWFLPSRFSGQLKPNFN